MQYERDLRMKKKAIAVCIKYQNYNKRVDIFPQSFLLVRVYFFFLFLKNPCFSGDFFLPLCSPLFGSELNSMSFSLFAYYESYVWRTKDIFIVKMLNSDDEYTIKIGIIGFCYIYMFSRSGRESCENRSNNH